MSSNRFILKSLIRKTSFSPMLFNCNDVQLRSCAIKYLVPCLPLEQQVRNVWIFRRKNYTAPSRLGNTSVRPLRYQDNIYEVIHPILGPKPMKKIKIILLDNVDDIGSMGEIVDVKPITALNKLLLSGKGVYASPDNLQKYEDLINDDTIDTPSTRTAFKIIKMLPKLLLNICMNDDTPWIVQPWHIQLGLTKAGIQTPITSIILPSSQQITGPDLDKEGKQFLAIVKINNKEKVNIRCRLYHVTTETENILPSSTDDVCDDVSPLFVEEGSLLQEMVDKIRSIKKY